MSKNHQIRQNYQIPSCVTFSCNLEWTSLKLERVLWKSDWSFPKIPRNLIFLETLHPVRGWATIPISNPLPEVKKHMHMNLGSNFSKSCLENKSPWWWFRVCLCCREIRRHYPAPGLGSHESKCKVHKQLQRRNLLKSLMINARLCIAKARVFKPGTSYPDSGVWSSTQLQCFQPDQFSNCKKLNLCWTEKWNWGE